MILFAALTLSLIAAQNVKPVATPDDFKDHPSRLKQATTRQAVTVPVLADPTRVQFDPVLDALGYRLLIYNAADHSLVKSVDVGLPIPEADGKIRVAFQSLPANVTYEARVAALGIDAPSDPSDPASNPFSYTPVVFPESPDRTQVPPALQLVDANAAVWTIGTPADALAILVNGALAANGRGSKILYVKPSIYVYGSDLRWYLYTGSAWTPQDPPPNNPIPTPPPPTPPTPVFDCVANPLRFTARVQFPSAATGSQLRWQTNRAATITFDPTGAKWTVTAKDVNGCVVVATR